MISQEHSNGTDTPRFRLIDLFAGAGGLTLGFTKKFNHNFEPVWANDFNKAAVETYNANFGDHCVHDDLVDLLKDEKTKIPKAHVVIGGLPCQGFSLLNKNREGDERRHLWKPFLEVVKRSEAKVFLIENVPQLLHSEEFKDIESAAKEMGFTTAQETLCAADYGVAQTRYRAFIIGCNFIDPAPYFPPKRTHYNPNDKARTLFKLNGDYVDDPKPWRTVEDEIANLPPPVGTDVRDAEPPFNLHFGRNPTPTSLARYMAIPEEGMNRFDLQRNAPELTPPCWIKKKSGGTDLFGRLWWKRPSVTIRTEFYKPEKGRYLHPVENRPITFREAARFQSFPDTFVFKGSKIEIAKQIGNAVPPLLAARLADVVEGLLTMHQS